MRIDAWAWHLACNSGEIPLKMRYFNEIFIRKELQSIQKWRRNKKFQCNDSIRLYSFWTFWSAEHFTIILMGRILYHHLDGPNTLRSFWLAEYFTIILMGQILYDHLDGPNTLRSFWSAEHFTIILIGRIQWKDYFYVSDSQWSKMCTLGPLTQNILQHLVNQILFTRTRN